MAFSAFITSLVAAVASLQKAVSATSVAPRAGQPVLRWDGPVFEGKPWMTFYVTDVIDLWGRVLATNPQWIIHAADPDATLGDYGERLCGCDGGVATGNSDEIIKLLSRLRQLGGYWTLDAGKCHRLGCGPDAGVYWCNNNKWNIRTSADALHLRASHIRDGCCHYQEGSLDEGDPMSGVEWFPNNHKEAAHSNVAIGFGSCSDPGDIVPIAYTFPGKVGQGQCRA